MAWSKRKVVRIDRKKLPGIDHVGDNLKIAPSLAASGDFKIIDLDAYGNPWPLFHRVVDQLPSGDYGFAITCGIRRSLITKCGNKDVYKAIGFPTNLGVNILPFYDDIVCMMLDRRNLRVNRLCCTKPDKVGLTVRYFGALVTKTGEAASNPPRQQPK